MHAYVSTGEMEDRGGNGSDLATTMTLFLWLM